MRLLHGHMTVQHHPSITGPARLLDQRANQFPAEIQTSHGGSHVEPLELAGRRVMALEANTTRGLSLQRGEKEAPSRRRVNARERRQLGVQPLKRGRLVA